MTFSFHQLQRAKSSIAFRKHRFGNSKVRISCCKRNPRNAVLSSKSSSAPSSNKPSPRKFASSRRTPIATSTKYCTGRGYVVEHIVAQRRTGPSHLFTRPLARSRHDVTFLLLKPSEAAEKRRGWKVWSRNARGIPSEFRREIARGAETVAGQVSTRSPASGANADPTGELPSVPSSIEHSRCPLNG